jgi:hypothetical protein
VGLYAYSIRQKGVSQSVAVALQQAAARQCPKQASQTKPHEPPRSWLGGGKNIYEAVLVSLRIWRSGRSGHVVWRESWSLIRFRQSGSVLTLLGQITSPMKPSTIDPGCVHSIDVALHSPVPIVFVPQPWSQALCSATTIVPQPRSKAGTRESDGSEFRNKKQNPKRLGMVGSTVCKWMASGWLRGQWFVRLDGDHCILFTILHISSQKGPLFYAHNWNGPYGAGAH